MIKNLATYLLSAPAAAKVLVLGIALISSLHPATSSAEEWTLRVVERLSNSSLSPVEGIRFYGNNGASDLAGLFTNRNGTANLNTLNTKGRNPVIAPSGGMGQGLRFEPPMMTPSLSACPDRVCTFQAINDGKPSVIIGWQVKDNSGKGVEGFPVSLSAPYL
ncbi:MAG: hypothetical protein DCC75_10885, partial [Proteobacteria bacterium]